MASLESVLEQALQLDERERGELIDKLVASLGPEPGEALSAEEWEAAWGDEIDRRVREIRDGKAELIDGDEALARVRANIEARRR